MPAMLPEAAHAGRGSLIGGSRCAGPTLDLHGDEEGDGDRRHGFEQGAEVGDDPEHEAFDHGVAAMLATTARRRVGPSARR